MKNSRAGTKEERLVSNWITGETGKGKDWNIARAQAIHEFHVNNKTGEHMTGKHQTT